MGVPAAKKGDQIVGLDTHSILMPSGVVPMPLPFNGIIDNNLSANVNINGMPAATKGSTATNQPAHIPPGGSFTKPPTNKGEIIIGSATVNINGKPMARMGDTANTCNDPSDMPVGTVVAVGEVFCG